MRSASATLVSALLLGVALAGCAVPGAERVDAADANASPPAPRARVVVAGIDTGINAYHVEFRDHGPDAYRHPSEYLVGYPADTPALWLTLNATDYEEAVLADCEAWQSVETGKMYWIPGTRIVGAITFEEFSDIPCEEDDLPGAILDRGSHGTMISSRIAGGTYSLCPECKIVFIQGFHSDSMKWSAEQPFIDLQTNSWGALPINYKAGLQGFSREDVVEAAAKQPTFVAGGNGLLGFFGVSGHPAYFDDIAGPEGVIMVGGHDGGRFTPWTMTMPHVVADAMMHPAAHHDSIDGGDDRTGGGTSGATPFAAGVFARMLLEARALVADFGTGVRDGNLVWGSIPGPAEGPLSDGFLSVEEAKVVFFHTANPRPVRDGDRDGPSCEPGPSIGCALYPTAPVEWGMIPDGVPAYYFVGYGQVGELTLNGTLAVVRGEAPLPERPVEDAFYGFDSRARRAFDG
ncbi:MAG TPA: S8 family serine peptidase [Candidatus Thermoplasmatota archaeon]|nr:S8 family serine peptidase [Candidatus Thermoplasmatota archaeon]